MIESLITDDAPVRTLAGDLLGRRQFIESLADAMLLPPKRGCRVISLEGGWGEGKTSTIEMTLDLIGARDADLKPFVVRINPWQLGSSEALVSSLLLELSKLARGEARIRKAKGFATLANELLRYSSALSLLKTEPHGMVIAAVMRASVWFSDKFFARRTDIESVKSRVSDAIKGAGRPIIVVIDDVDRLLPREVVEVVRFVRAVGNFERTTYLLAFDHPRIIEALTHAGVPSAARFLEKIVQLRTHVPPPSARAIRNILNSKLEESNVYEQRRIFEESESRRTEIYSFYLEPLLIDVRTLLRVLARVEVTPIAVVRGVEYWEVFALNVVSVVAPNIFDFIRANPTSFTNAHSGLPRYKGESSSIDQLNVYLDDLLKDIPVRTARYVRGLLYALFPLLRAGASRSGKWMDRNGRVGTERPLLTFLVSGVLEGEIPLDTARALIKEEQFRVERVAAICQHEEYLLVLVDTLRNELEGSDAEVVAPSSLLNVILEKSAELPPSDASEFARDRERAISLLPLVVKLLTAVSKPYEPILKIVKDEPSAVLAALLLESLSAPDGEAMRGLRKRLSEIELKLLGVQFASDVLAISTRYDNADRGRIGQLLFALRRIDKDAYEDVLGKLVPNRKGRRRILEELGNRIYSSKDGHVASWDWKMVPEELRPFMEEEATEVVQKSDQSNKALFAAAKSLLEGKEIVVDSGEPR